MRISPISGCFPGLPKWHVCVSVLGLHDQALVARGAGYSGGFSEKLPEVALCLAEQIPGSSKDRCAADEGWAN